MSDLLDIQQLTVHQRLELIGELWDSIDDHELEDDITPEQEAEMDRVMAEANAHPEACLSLETAFRELRARRPCLDSA